MNLKQYKNNYLLSTQYKKILFIAFQEAKYNNLATINSTCLLYALLKVESSLASRIFDKIFASKNLNKTKILNKLRFLIKEQAQQQSSEFSEKLPFLSKSVREILFFSIFQSKSIVITTGDLILATLSDKKIKKLISSLIFTN